MKKGGSTRLVFPVQSQKLIFYRGRVLPQNLLEFWNFYIYIYLLLLLLLLPIRLPRRFTSLKKIPKALFHFGILLEFFSRFGIFLFHPAKYRQPITKKSHTRHLFEMSSCGILMSVGRAILESRHIAFHGVVEFILFLIKEKS
jgi:hypothetical protein